MKNLIVTIVTISVLLNPNLTLSSDSSLDLQKSPLDLQQSPTAINHPLSPNQENQSKVLSSQAITALYAINIAKPTPTRIGNIKNNHISFTDLADQVVAACRKKELEKVPANSSFKKKKATNPITINAVKAVPPYCPASFQEYLATFKVPKTENHDYGQFTSIEVKRDLRGNILYRY